MFQKYFSPFISELQFWVGAITTLLFLTFGKSWLADLSSVGWYAFLFLWLLSVMLWLSFGVVRHAECLSILLGEPYGTLILTLSVISIEVVIISAVMLASDSNPTLARDTMFAVLMIVLNGMYGSALLLGGLRHHEQEYNLQGANSYLGVIVPLSILTLVLPRFTTSAPGGSSSTLISVFLAFVSIGLYGVFLGIQTMRHRHFFVQPKSDQIKGSSEKHHEDLPTQSPQYHALFLGLTMLPIILLSKSMAKLLDYGTAELGAPQAVGGFIVAILVLSPEGLASLRAAQANLLQRSINICMGSALATIGLTVPAVLAISLITGMSVELGLDHVGILLLVLTLTTSIVNASWNRTNILEGIVHILLFLAYVILIFDV